MAIAPAQLADAMKASCLNTADGTCWAKFLDHNQVAMLVMCDLYVQMHQVPGGTEMIAEAAKRWQEDPQGAGAAFDELCRRLPAPPPVDPTALPGHYL